MAYCLPERLRKSLSLLPQRAGAYCETVHLYLSPHITGEFMTEIKAFFGIAGDMKMHYEHTAHYRCYLDTEWRPES